MDVRALGRLAQDLKVSLAETRAGQSGVGPAFRAVQRFERMAGEVYLLRHRKPVGDEHRSYGEDMLASFSHELVFMEGRAPVTTCVSFTERYRRVWRDNFSLFLYAAVMFIVSLLVGYAFAAMRPEYAPVLVPQVMMEAVLNRTAWFERITEAPFLAGLQIAANNIGVVLKTFAGGALLGLGGVLLLCYNGLVIGALLGYCSAHNFDEPLGVFIIAHGPLELTIIVAGGFLSMLYGRAFFMRPFRDFGRHIKDGGRDAFIGICGVTPWLVLAALLEAFVSPYDYLSVGSRVALGCVAAAGFWVWTLWPPQRDGSS